MARMYNRNVQENALNFLQTYYHNRFENNTVLIGKNIKTKKGRIVGGLVACLPGQGPAFTAALEAHSLGTIHKFLPFLSQIGWIYKVLLLTITLALPVGLVYVLLPQLLLYALVPAATVLGLYLLFGLVTGAHHNLTDGELTRHISHLPANEKWLVLTVDTKVMDLHAQLDALRFKCEQKGIGIISVSNNRVSLVQMPKAQPSLPVNYLQQYHIDVPAPAAATTGSATTFIPVPVLSPTPFATIPAMIKAS